VNKLFYLLFASVVVIIVGALFMYTVESGKENSQINSVLDAFWWAVTTVTTVGYGDIIPVSDAGKILAIFYMFFGIGILVIFLSVIGTNFYKKRFEADSKDISHAQSLILKKMDGLEKNQEKIEQKLTEILDSFKKK
jgi:voltage-gated potassium channel